MGAAQSTQNGQEVSLLHFEQLRIIGKGAFGKVRIIRNKATKSLYALKYINKNECIQKGAIQNVFRERAILEELDHPYIVNLRYAFQDEQNLCFVLDLKTGGDLRIHLDQQGGFTEEAVKVWALELASAIQYLHSQNVVHRDIKPDNILLDQYGHAHLTDFNIAVKIDKTSTLQSKSGTLPYMAPEVFEGHGYYWQVDWWSLGVTLYELIYFKRPFRANRSSELKTKIQSAEIKFPQFNKYVRSRQQVSDACVSFLSELLDRNPFTRLGCRVRQILDVRQHRWLVEEDWSLVEQKKLASRYVPDPSTDYFDPRVNLDEFLPGGLIGKSNPRGRSMGDARINAKKAQGVGVTSRPNAGNRPRSTSRGSLMAYISGYSSDSKKARSRSRSTNASEAAEIAGDVHEMMKQYQTRTNAFNFFRRRGGNGKKLTESELVDIQLRFMKDHFLAYDYEKARNLSNQLPDMVREKTPKPILAREPTIEDVQAEKACGQSRGSHLISHSDRAMNKGRPLRPNEIPCHDSRSHGNAISLNEMVEMWNVSPLDWPETEHNSRVPTSCERVNVVEYPLLHHAQSFNESDVNSSHSEHVNSVSNAFPGPIESTLSRFLDSQVDAGASPDLSH